MKYIIIVIVFLSFQALVPLCGSVGYGEETYTKKLREIDSKYSGIKWTAQVIALNMMTIEKLEKQLAELKAEVGELQNLLKTENSIMKVQTFWLKELQLEVEELRKMVEENHNKYSQFNTNNHCWWCMLRPECEKYEGSQKAKEAKIEAFCTYWKCTCGCQ